MATKHFTMIRSFHLADLFTIANAFCGVGAIFEAMKFLSTHDRRHIYLAALLVPVAGLRCAGRADCAMAARGVADGA